MTDIVDVPAPVVVPPYPEIGQEGFGRMAYDVGTEMPNVVANINETAQSARTNALAAQEQAQTALQAAANANDARAAVWDAVGLQGQWLEATGAGQKGWVYKHSGRFWRLKQVVADISANEPTAEDDYWLALDAGTRPQIEVAAGVVACVTGVTYVITGADVTLSPPSAGLIQGDYFGFRLAAAVSGTQRVDFGAINVRGQSAGLRFLDKPGFALDLQFNAERGWV